MSRKPIDEPWPPKWAELPDLDTLRRLSQTGSPPHDRPEAKEFIERIKAEGKINSCPHRGPQ